MTALDSSHADRSALVGTVVVPDADVPQDVRAVLAEVADSTEFSVLGIALAPRGTLSTGGSVADAVAESAPWYHAVVTGSGVVLAQILRQRGFSRAVAVSQAFVAIRAAD